MVPSHRPHQNSVQVPVSSSYANDLLSPRTKKVENLIQRIKNFKYDHLKNYYNALNSMPPNAPLDYLTDHCSGKSPMEMITGINFFKEKKEQQQVSPFPNLP